MEWLILLGIFFLFVRFTVVEEGTAKIIMRFKGVIKVFIQWTGSELDEGGNVVKTKEKIPKRPWYGGLRVWIGLPIDKVYTFKLRWHSVEEVEGKRMPVFHEEPENCVLLRPDRYWRKSLRMETNDGQFPDVEWLTGMRSINPEKTIFRSPHNWVENALTQLEPLLRRYVYTKTLKELLDLTREQIWKDIGDERAIQIVLKGEWGIQIDDNEIGVLDVSPPPGSQEAFAAKTRKEMEAAGRAEEIMGTVISAVARAEGRKEEEVQAKFRTNPKAFYQKHQPIIDNTMTKLSIEEGAYLRIETPGATGMEGSFLRLIGAFSELFSSSKRMPDGGSEQEPKEEKKEEKTPEEKKQKKLTRKEINKKMEEEMIRER